MGTLRVTDGMNVVIWGFSLSSFIVTCEVYSLSVLADSTLDVLPMFEKKSCALGNGYRNNDRMYAASRKVTADIRVTSKWFDNNLTLFKAIFKGNQENSGPFSVDTTITATLRGIAVTIALNKITVCLWGGREAIVPPVINNRPSEAKAYMSLKYGLLIINYTMNYFS